MALHLSCCQGYWKSSTNNWKSVECSNKMLLFPWTLSSNSSDSSLTLTVHFLPSSPTLTWLGSIQTSGSGTDLYLFFQEVFSGLTSSIAFWWPCIVSEGLYIYPFCNNYTVFSKTCMATYLTRLWSCEQKLYLICLCIPRSKLSVSY